MANKRHLRLVHGATRKLRKKRIAFEADSRIAPEPSCGRPALEAARAIRRNLMRVRLDRMLARERALVINAVFALSDLCEALGIPPIVPKRAKR
jgi:hypothetical protein